MFDRKFVTLGRLLQHWDIIVGKDLAASTTPIKVTYRKKGKDAELGLIISTDSAQAMVLHYRKDLILEKINQILGDKTISTLKFVDQSTDLPKKKPPEKSKSLTQEQEKDLSTMLDDVEDDELKKTLERFGSSLLIDTHNANENN